MLLLTLLLLLPAATAYAQDGFRSLFNGKDLKGWSVCNGKATYSVENGAIVGVTAEGSPNSFLCTDREYADFILEFEERNDPALNSGVQIRSHRYGADAKVMTNDGKRIQERTHPEGRVHGYQVEISSEKSADSGGIYDEARRGWLHNVSSDPKASKAFGDNQWNKYRVEAIGDHIRTWINGIPCADLRDPVDQSGFIALQVHAYRGAQQARVQWRNLRIRELGRHGWKPLFDGKTMAGWTEQGPGTWTIENGAFHARSAPGETASGFLVNSQSFRDATIRVFFKIVPTPAGDGNSGFFVRSDPNTHAGYEVEIDEKKGTGGLFEVGGRKWVTGPEDNAAVRPGDWNELVASTHGDRIVFHLNGIKTLDLPNDTVGHKEGHVILQVHNKRVTDIWFKDPAVLTAEPKTAR